MDTGTPALLTANQVATMLNISKRTLWRLVSAKKLPGLVKVSKHSTRFDRSTVERWIARGCK
jgi:excisionase family DNA binding protein